MNTSILIIEDEQEIVTLLQTYLSKEFHHIFVAENGLAAQKIIKEKNLDIILCDINMPQMNGFDFLTKLRAEGLNTPVIMVSSSKDRADIVKAMKLGVQDFIEKPFKKKDVEMAIYRVLEVSVRSNTLPDLISKYGVESYEVKQQRKMIGLLQVLNAKGLSKETSQSAEMDS